MPIDQMSSVVQGRGGVETGIMGVWMGSDK